MALNEDTETLSLAYVYGELSASAARDFERRMDAGTPEAAELRAEVEGMRASRELFGKDAAFGLRTGVDVPPAHLVDAIMNAEKLSRLPAVRDAALARVAPPVDKSFTAKLSRWLLGGGVAVGAAAALFFVVTQGPAQEPRLQSESMADSIAAKDSAGAAAVVIDAPKAEMAPQPVEAPPSPDASPNAPQGGAFADNTKLAGVAEEKLSDDRLADKLGGIVSNADRNSATSGDVAGAADGFASAPAIAQSANERRLALEGANKPMVVKPTDAEPENDAPAQDPAMRAGRGRADDDAKKQPAYKADAKREENGAKLDAVSAAKTKSKEAAKDSARQAAKESPKEATKSRDSGDDFSFDSVIAPAKGAKAEKKAEPKADKKAEEKSITLRDSEKAGMRSSIGADKDMRGSGGLGLGASGGVATGAASSSGSGPGAAPPTKTTTTSPTPPATTPPATTVPMTPPADAPSRAMSPPPPPVPLAKAPPKPNVVADAKPAPSEADDEESTPVPAKKVISREALEEQRKNVRKKSTAGSGKSVGADTERAKRLEQANIALASAQREMAGKRWLSAFDQMALAESLDIDRALGATPLVGQMRSLVQLKRPVDAARVARRLGRWDVKGYDVVPGLLLGAQVAEQIGDERLARELWTRLLEVPTEKAKARAALDRMEGTKALRRQQYDSDAAEAPAMAAPAQPASESAKE